ncbi:iron complex outermembrane recepter protein [Xylanibacter ruminicola]|uniref:Iron complex outermembrane recepter protein n=1 Tax=Xylanibacter ruminicola TaxID=839 RepID=A0A1H5RU69_XYLRU|nr:MULTISPECIES: TonB-dependent receptor [Prevotellaceae]SEF41041.1 iron complex outermembrane recepter protein [Xylanibacter ruminicola]SEW10942.1 iron complex outermembrane recepter protein [Prevotella sp. khp7]
MYKPTFNMKRQRLVFRHFGNKGYSLFACLGREVVCSVLSVATLTYASAESVATKPVVTDSATMTTAREMMLEEVSVTGSRAPLTKSQAARMVTVLERQDIAQAPVQSINDLLKYAVGVDVRQRGPIGAQTDISIRGGTSDQIILLLNGINICDPQTGHNAMDLPIDLSEIVRIEVVEGPAGRIYGTSSLVGAINIVTKPALQTSTDLTLEGGSYGYAKASGRTNLKLGLWNNQVSASYSRSDGYSRSKAGTLNTDFSGSKAFYQGQYEDETIRLNWHLGMADKGYGSSTFWASPKWQADNQYEHTTKLYSAIQGETKLGRLHFAPSIYWNQNRDRYEGYRDMPEKMKFNYNRTDVYGVGLSSYFDWKAGRTAFGAELRNEDLVSGNLGEPLTQAHHIKGTDREYTLGVNRTNISGFLEHNLLLKHFTLSAGLVAVKNSWSNMNMTVYPGIDISYRPNNKWTLHTSYNTSLRMPSFTEMYYKLQGYSANPHLKPEEMRALEAGITYHTWLVTFSTTIWHHHGRNMIDWIMDTSKGDEAVWQSVNHTKVNSIGAELSATVRLQQAVVKLSYSYINQEKNLEAGVVSQYALEYLRHKLVAHAQLPLWRQLTLYVNLRWQDRVGQYTDFDGIAHNYQPYTLIDSRLSWQQKTWKLYVEANNLFDKDYVDFGHVQEPGRWIITGFSIRL